MGSTVKSVSSSQEEGSEGRAGGRILKLCPVSGKVTEKRLRVESCGRTRKGPWRVQAQ